jgi:hypothetical protein
VVLPAKLVINETYRPIKLILLINILVNMNNLTLVPLSGESEELKQKGFIVLNLIKYAVYTLIKSFNEYNMLYIIIFLITYKVINPFIY